MLCAWYGVETAAAVVVAYQKLRGAPLPHCSSHRPPPASALGEGGAAAEGEVAAVEGVGVAAAAGAAVEKGEEEEGEGYYYMAAMRSAGDYAITCRVRQMARSLRRRRHRVYAYYFTHTPNRSINYANLESIGAFHGAEVPFAKPHTVPNWGLKSRFHLRHSVPSPTQPQGTQSPVPGLGPGTSPKVVEIGLRRGQSRAKIVILGVASEASGAGGSSTAMTRVEAFCQCSLSPGNF